MIVDQSLLLLQGFVTKVRRFGLLISIIISSWKQALEGNGSANCDISGPQNAEDGPDVGLHRVHGYGVIPP